MNTDIRLKTTFSSHAKVKRLRRTLGSDAVLSLLFLWLYAAENRPHGELRGMDEIDIAEASQWAGDPKMFTDALQSINFLDKKRGLFSLHNWESHNAWAVGAPSRSEKAKKAAKAKWSKDKEKKVCYEQDQAMLNDARSYAPSPSPSPSLLKDKNLSASGDAGQVEEGDFLLTKKRRKLSGKRLETFTSFWTAFDLKKGKAEAADAWLDIPQLTVALVAQIIEAAKREASERSAQIAKGHTPKWAQGWLTARRWEDEVATTETAGFSPVTSLESERLRRKLAEYE